MNDDIYFAIDGGGTKSRLIFKSESDESKIFYGLSTNVFSCGYDKAIKNVNELLLNAIAELKIDKKKIIGGCFASAGLFRDNEINIFKSYFNSILSCEVKLVTDAEAFLVGSHNDLEGLILIAGTGSIALARDKDSKIYRSGGLGWRLGDEGSAVYIGNQAIQRSIKSSENRDLKTSMLEALLNKLKLEDINDCVRFFHDEKIEKSKVASIARIVTDYAYLGDELALDIISKSIDELILLISSVIKQSNNKVNKLCLSGGVFENDEFIRDKFVNKFSSLYTEIKIYAPKGSALDGAMIIARNK